MNIVLFGPPGVGKGTEAHLLANRLSILHISTGDMLRQEVKENTCLGKEAQAFMNHGKLVPDEVIMAMVKKRLKQICSSSVVAGSPRSLDRGNASPGSSDPGAKQSHNGFVLDGVPRTLNQAEVLQEILKELDSNLNFVIELEAREEVLIERLSGRRVCRKCHALYHIINMKPKKEGICDRCGGELYERHDDKVATIKRRLKIYEEETQGLKEFYKEKGILITINTEGNAEETFEKIYDCLTLKR